VEQQLGSILYYNSKGFGFLADANEQEIYFHIKDVQPLPNGARMLPKIDDLYYFSLRPSKRKPGFTEAFNLVFVRRAEPLASAPAVDAEVR